MNNLFLGAGVGANLYGAYFVLAFQGHLPPDWLPGALLGYDDAVARGDDRRSTRAGEGAGGVRGNTSADGGVGEPGMSKVATPQTPKRGWWGTRRPGYERSTARCAGQNGPG